MAYAAIAVPPSIQSVAMLYVIDVPRGQVTRSHEFPIFTVLESLAVR